MKSQALFSSKDKSKKLKCRLLQILFGALRVKLNGYTLRRSALFLFFASFFNVIMRMKMCFRGAIYA